ncbi:7753_t:CDS:2, partial [Funneliformis mosseae]
MFYLLVQVNENIKCIISERIVSIESTTNKFCDLFDAITVGQYNNREQEVDNDLNGNLKMLEVFGFLQVKFCLIANINSDTPASTQ